MIVCPYCKSKAIKVTGKVIYPTNRTLYGRIFWHCKPCGAYVGCHDGTDIPLGTLADGETRKARHDAHAVFDRIWKDGHMSRHDAYFMMSCALFVREFHIGDCDIAMCERVIAISNDYLKTVKKYAKLSRFRRNTKGLRQEIAG